MGNTILKGVVLLYPHVSLPWGEKRKSGTGNEQIQTLVKEFPPSMVERVESAKSMVYRAFEGISHDFPYVRGVWAVPTSLQARAEARFLAAQEAFWYAVDDMGSEYDLLRATAEANLGPHFRPRDYPAWSVLRGRIRCELVTFTLAETSPVAGGMDFGDLLASFKREAYDTLCSSLQEILKAMVFRLTEGRCFHYGTVGKFQEFLETFGNLAEVVQDTEYEGDLSALKTLVSDAQKCLGGHVPEDYKTDKNLRAFTGGLLSRVAENLDRVMALPAGARKLDLSDDEVA